MVEQMAGNGDLREFLVRQLGKLSAAGNAVAIDLQTRSPLPTRQIAQSAIHPAAEIDLALALDGGLIVGGWMHDPANLLADIEYLPESGNAVSLKPHFHKFAGKIAKREDAPQQDVTGFVAWLPSAKTSDRFYSRAFRCFFRPAQPHRWYQRHNPSKLLHSATEFCVQFHHSKHDRMCLSKYWLLP